jgi:hypothetical protein
MFAKLYVCSHRERGRRIGAKGIAIARLLARFPKAHISDPDFTPIYGGAVGELRLQSLPMVIQ